MYANNLWTGTATESSSGSNAAKGLDSFQYATNTDHWVGTRTRTGSESDVSQPLAQNMRD